MIALIILAAIVSTWWIIPKLFGAGKRYDTDTGMDPLYGDVPRLDQIRHGDDFNE